MPRKTRPAPPSIAHWVIDVAIPFLGLIVILCLLGLWAYNSQASSELGFHQTILPPTECADSVDNDSDGLTDWPNDPECETDSSESESQGDDNSGGGGGGSGSSDDSEDNSGESAGLEEDDRIISPIDSTRADFNGDRVVNALDFALMVSWLGLSSPPESLDITGNGIVTLRDVSIFVYHWSG